MSTPVRPLVPPAAEPRTKRSGRAVLPGLAVAAALCLVTTPASADPTDGTDVVVTVPGGSLQIAVDDDPVSLSQATTDAGRTVVSGRLGRVTVSDRRNAPAGSGWVADVVATDFTGRGRDTLSSGQLRYEAGPVATEGTVTVTTSTARGLRRPTAVVTATGVRGNNSAWWDPVVTVVVPPGLAPGTYRGTITHSVL